MRHETCTVVVLAGDVSEGLLAELGRSANVSVVRAPAEKAAPGKQEAAVARPGWEAGALALREAARRQTGYVIVPDDPLADVAAEWRAMWDVTGSQGGAGEFEAGAAEVLAAWRDKRFELPDYYLVMPAAMPGQAGQDGTGQEGTGQDLYLGPLRATRPRRVAVAGLAVAGLGGGAGGQASQVLAALGSLPHGPWWPPLDALIDGARRFYAGGLTETQAVAG
jgi:hypothetical protein